MMNAIKKNFILKIYLLLAIIYFVASLKLSGAEAYHSSGIIAYIKWSLLALLINIGYVFSSIFRSRKNQLLLVPIMILAIISNVLIYQNTLNRILYFSLALLVIACGILLVLEKAFQYVQDLYLKK